MTFNYDVIVVGAGHAGCEAAAAGPQIASIPPIWVQRRFSLQWI